MQHMSQTAVYIIEKTVRKVWPDYKYPYTREQDAALTHKLRMAVSRALENLLRTIEFPLACDEAVLCAEDAAHSVWFRAATGASPNGGCVTVCARANIAVFLFHFICLMACRAQCDK
jgi:hypothetical protein